MRAWYGKGRFWFVVAASANASTAWGWYGYKGRWDLLGREFEDWLESDFGDAIELSAVPAELLATLAATLDSVAADRPTTSTGARPVWHELVPADGRYH